MGELEHTIEKESKLVEMLGYQLVGPDNAARWIIIDSKQNQVGFIQFEKIPVKGKKKKEKNKCYGYHMLIDSDTIYYNDTRELGDPEEEERNQSHNFYYEFDVKRPKGKIDRVNLRCGDDPSLTVWSEKYGFINFRVDFEGLYLNFKDKTKHFNLEEILVFKKPEEDGHHYAQEFTYQLRWSPKKYPLQDDKPKGRTSVEISGTHSYYDEDNKLNVSVRKWVEANLKYRKDSVVDGTVDELAEKQELGIECVRHFRHLINEALPFQGDLLTMISDPETLKRYNLSLFFPDIVNGEQVQYHKTSLINQE